MTTPALYLSAHHVSWRTAADVEHLSLVTSERGDFIVTGGEKSSVILLGDPKPWGAFLAKDVTAWAGTALGPCEVEVDATSGVFEGAKDPAPGSIVRRGTSLSILVLSNSQGFYDPVRVPLPVQLSGAKQDLGLWFPRWRLVLRADGARQTVREFDISPGASDSRGA